jgi:hypothetical protein
MEKVNEIFFGNFSVPFKTIGKLIVPNANEIEENNRARSAKLRIAEKKIKNENGLYSLLKAKFLVNDDAKKLAIHCFCNCTSYYYDCKYTKI